MKIRDFGVEQWMNLYENHCTHNLAETCVHPLTLAQLLELCGSPAALLEELCAMQMTYGDIEGSDRLVGAIASLYQTAQPENIAVTHGAIGANAIVLLSLVEPGDHVISVLPTYQQLYSIPESLGAEVELLQLREEDGWLPDPERLRAMLRPNTRMICINNPNNPTGAVMDQDCLMDICRIAHSVGAYLLCDEVYRGLTHQGDPYTVSPFDLYDRAISTGSLSKTYSLAGLRMGWVAASENVIRSINRQRDYHIISCGKLNDRLAALALENRDKIVGRSLELVRRNKAILAQWVEEQPHISWLEPQGGTTALLFYNMDIPSQKLCARLQAETGVMLLPGSVMEMEGYLRIGYACETPVLQEGLARFGGWLTANFG